MLATTPFAQEQVAALPLFFTNDATRDWL